MSAFISFDEFSGIVSRGSGILLFVITEECDVAAHRQGRQLRQIVGRSAAVHLLCAELTTSPTLVFYQGGDPRPLVSREGPESVRLVSDDLTEAVRRAASRPTADEEAERQEDAAKQTERMLASERLDQFPPFFRMARTLARDAWYAARRSAEGAPLLLSSDAAAVPVFSISTNPGPSAPTWS